MDDDDLRRGQPTTHRAFDEATAILAGDALQVLAFSLLARDRAAGVSSEARLKMIQILADASGTEGMAGGQALDLSAVGRKLHLEELEAMHRLKTGALIRASGIAGRGMCAGVDPGRMGMRWTRIRRTSGSRFKSKTTFSTSRAAPKISARPSVPMRRGPSPLTQRPRSRSRQDPRARLEAPRLRSPGAVPRTYAGVGVAGLLRHRSSSLEPMGGRSGRRSRPRGVRPHRLHARDSINTCRGLHRGLAAARSFKYAMSAADSACRLRPTGPAAQAHRNRLKFLEFAVSAPSRPYMNVAVPSRSRM